MISAAALAFLFTGQPALAPPSRVTTIAQKTIRYRKKRRHRHKVAPPSATQAEIDDAPAVKLVRVIPIVRPGPSAWLLWNDRVDPETDARARAAVRVLFFYPGSVQGVTQ